MADKRSAVTMQIVGVGSYMNIWEPKEVMGGGTKKFSLSLLLSKKDEQLPRIKKAIEQVAIEMWGPGAVKLLASGKLKNPLRDGDDKEQEHYQGKMFFNASSAKKPGIVKGPVGQVEQVLDPEEVYSGCTVQVSVNFYAFDVKAVGSKGVAAGLNNIRLIKAGERLDGRVSAVDEKWTEVAGEEEAAEDLLA